VHAVAFCDVFCVNGAYASSSIWGGSTRGCSFPVEFDKYKMKFDQLAPCKKPALFTDEWLELELTFPRRLAVKAKTLST